MQLRVDSTAVLGRARQTCDPALKQAVGSLHPALSAIAAYHLGWRDADGSVREGRGGKAVRPALALLSAEAAGGVAEQGVPGAVAVELVHNFSILHDDVMDGDRLRRHRPTAWSVFGVGQAVLAGDALLALAGEVLLSKVEPRRIKADRLLTSAVTELIRGQAEDLIFERRDWVSVAEYRTMSANKTGALLACATSIGAVLAGAHEPLVRSLARAGRHLGLAYQAVDDLLGIWGSESTTGKPVYSDLRRKKKSLPIVAALNAEGPASAEFRRIFSGEMADPEVVARAAELLEAAGGREITDREVDLQLEMAVAAIDRIEIPADTREELTCLMRYLATRKS